MGSIISEQGGSVEVDLLRRAVGLVQNRLLRMHRVVGVVEHLLHGRQHRLVDVGGSREHHLIVCWRADQNVVAVLLAVCLLDDHARVFHGLVGCVVCCETVVACVDGATRRRN